MKIDHILKRKCFLLIPFDEQKLLTIISLGSGPCEHEHETQHSVIYEPRRFMESNNGGIMWPLVAVVQRFLLSHTVNTKTQNRCGARIQIVRENHHVAVFWVQTFRTNTIGYAFTWNTPEPLSCCFLTISFPVVWSLSFWVLLPIHLMTNPYS